MIVWHDIDGSCYPAYTSWKDERYFIVDEIVDVRYAKALKVGEEGVRFLVRIGEKEAFLFYENPSWFVEKKVYEKKSISMYGNAYKNKDP